MKAIALLIMKATEARLAALTSSNRSPKYVAGLGIDGVPVVLADEVEKIRADLYLAILELEEAPK